MQIFGQSELLNRRENECLPINAAPSNLLLRTLTGSDERFLDGDALPIAWHWMHFVPATKTSDLFEDGRGAPNELVPHMDGYSRMWAGGAFEIYTPLRIGENVERKSRLVDVAEKSGQSGRLVLVTVQHDFSVDESLCLRETQNVVFRAAGGNLNASAGKKNDIAPVWIKEIVPNEVLLMRYSALTFNAHRIHYDKPYTTQVEGYPDLLVQGPLTCTLILELLRENADYQNLGHFKYRAIRPAFVNKPLKVCAAPDATGKKLRLWAEDQVGYMIMEASASFKGEQR